MNPTTPTPTPTPTPVVPGQPGPTPSQKRGYRALNRRATQAARVVGLLFAILVIGGGLGYYIAHVTKVSNAPVKSPEVKTLSSEELNKLSSLGSNLGTSNQLLTIGATAQFNNNVIINKDLSITGRLNANGPVTLKSLTISGGDTAISGLTVGGNLAVAGTTTLQRGATIGQLLALTGNLAVAGTANFGALSAATITVKNLALTGPFVISHLNTQGPLPSSSTGSAAGGGGTSSVSGNDAAGTVNINLGSSTGSGILMNVNFKSAYASNVHVLLTPLSGPAAAANVYITRSQTGFQIRTDNPLPGGGFLSFDYFVVQ
jgi:hypothetical protein